MFVKICSFTVHRKLQRQLQIIFFFFFFLTKDVVLVRFCSGRPKVASGLIPKRTHLGSLTTMSFLRKKISAAFIAAAIAFCASYGQSLCTFLLTATTI